MSCKHESFDATVKVIRLSDEPGGEAQDFMSEIRICCLDCRHPFEFIGVAAGLSGMLPMSSVDAQELRAPVRPAGSDRRCAIPGYAITKA
jgi:hypothetical protein